MVPHRTSRRTGVTAVQLLVVLAVLLMLLAFLAPLVARVREAATRTQSINNLKQLSLGTINAADTYRAMLPPVVGEFQNKTGSLHFFILPFIEQGQLYNEGQDGVWDKEVWSKVIPTFLDDRDASAPPGRAFEGWLATTNYPANWLVFRDGQSTRRYPASIPDGTSNTLMFATRYQMCNGTPTAWGYPGMYTWAPQFAYYSMAVPQRSPTPADCDPERPQAIGNATIVGFCDGSARTINPLISAETWGNVCGPADGNVLGNDLE